MRTHWPQARVTQWSGRRLLAATNPNRPWLSRSRASEVGVLPCCVSEDGGICARVEKALAALVAVAGVHCVGVRIFGVQWRFVNK